MARFVKAATLGTVVALCVASGLLISADRASGWSSTGGVQDAHGDTAGLVLDWFANNAWTFEGHKIQTRTGFLGLTNPWNEVKNGASTEVDCAWKVLGVDVCEWPGGTNDTYHSVTKYQQKFWQAYPDKKQEFCDAAGLSTCELDPLMGAEERTVYWTTKARQCVDDLRAQGKTNPSDYSTCQKYAGYALHYAQDAVNPPHVDPWAQGWWWGTQPAPSMCEELHDADALQSNKNEIDLGRTQITILDEELNIGLPTLKNAIVALADETEAEWPDPANLSDWATWDPWRGAERSFWDYDCANHTETDDRIVHALERSALLSKSILIYVFGFSPPKLDLAFVIDTTGSMSDDIAAAKSAATEIVNRVAANVPDFRIAVVDFRDFPISPYGGGGDYDYHDALAFTSNKTEAISAINGLSIGWGNDELEDDYCALMHAINGATCRGSGVGSGIGAWRNIPSKFIILMTDAPPHDPEPFTGYHWSDVVTAAKNADPITVEVIGIGGVSSYLAQIASGTGGQVFSAASASEVVAAIMDAIQAILDSPVADAGGPYQGFVGSAITFDAGSSYDPDGVIVSYEWDWESDGVYDEVTSDPLAAHTYASSLAGLVTLRVTDDDGLTSVDTAEISVLGNKPPELTVPEDQAVQYSDPLDFSVSASDPDDDALTLTASGLPAGLTFVDNGDGTGDVSGTAQVAAGTYPITFTVSDGINPPVSDGLNVVVSKEDATLAYSGDSLVKKGLPVTLRANVAEMIEVGPWLGDITKAAVFFDVAAAIGGGTTTYGPASVSATGEATWTLPSGLPANVYSVDVRIDPANVYYTAPPADTAALVVYDPAAGFTTGGGWVPDGDGRGNFGFSVKYLKSGNIQGQALYVYRSDGMLRRVKSNSMQWLVINGNTAVFQGKATIDGLGGNNTFEITVVDNGEPGRNDTFAIKIWDSGGTLIHEVTGTTLGGGNLIVPQPKRR